MPTAYKPEHAVDLGTGVIVAAPIHGADEGDTATLLLDIGAHVIFLTKMNLAQTRPSPRRRSN